MNVCDWQVPDTGHRDAVAAVLAEDLASGRIKIDLIADRHGRVGGGASSTESLYFVVYMFGYLNVAESREAWAEGDDYSTILRGADRAMLDELLGIDTLIAI